MANVVLMAMEIDGGDRQRPLADGDTVANLNFNSGLFNQLRTYVGLNVPVGQDGLPLLSGLSAALLAQLRGVHFFVKGATGEEDKELVIVKDDTENYVYREIAFIPVE